MPRTLALLVACGLVACLPSGFAGAGPASGTLVLVVSDNPDNLNPYLHSLMASQQVYGFVFDSLYRVNDRGAWEPALATREQVSADGLVWTYTLRPGVRWSDGRPLTSADVKYTWQLATNKDVHISYATGFDKIASVAAPTASTVVFRLKTPYAPFREQVAGAPIVPQHVLGGLTADQINHAPFNQHPLGTGPFRVSEFVADDHVTLTANPYYWGATPKLRQIVVRVVPDQNTQVNLLRAGDLSVLQGVPPARLDEVRRFPGVRLERYLAPVYALVQLDEYQALRDVRVRQALDFATPKAAIIKSLMRGQAEPAVSDMVPDGPWANHRLLPRPYDPGRARSLLRDAGFVPGAGGYLVKDGARLEVPLWTVSSRLYFVQATQLIAQAWHAVGVYTEPHAVSSAALFGQNGPQWDGRDAALIFSWGQGVFPENRINWASAYIPADANSAGENAERYRNPEMDRLLDAADRAVDPARRRAIYDEIQALEYRDVPVIFLFWYVNNDAVAANVRGYTATTFGATPPETWSTQ
jgi:peptide/nickel transport system substrate-binding protein